MTQKAHEARALTAGRHFYSEKPLALDPAQAQELLDLADTHGVRLAGSPSVWLGPAAQTAWREIERGAIGRVRVVYANADHGRIETWHPNPAGFYDVGPVFDVGVYPIALLPVIHGPVRSVRATGTVLLEDRITKAGQAFRPGTDDFVVAMLTMADGTLVRLTCSFYVDGEHAAHVVEVVDAIARSSASGSEVVVTSSFPRPAPIGWE